MKKNYILIFFLILMLLSAVYPVIYYYSNDTAPEIPPHTTYRQVVDKILPDSIKIKAEKFHCRGNIAPVEGVSGGNRYYFPSLKEDVNLALFNYSGWKVRANSDESYALKKRMQERITDWGNLDPRKIQRISKIQAKNAFNTIYITDAKLIEKAGNNFNNLQLIVSVNNINTQNSVFTIKINFVHPGRLKEAKQKIIEIKNKLDNAEKINEISLSALKISSGGFLLFLLFIAGDSIYRKRKKILYERYLRSEIGKRQELIDGGHFVAALELAEKYLNAFPDDTEIIAFRNRILDFTNNDSQKAQLAFVQAQKIRARLNMAADDPRQALLSRDEKEEIQLLMPYNPELKKSYLALVSAEESVIKKEKFNKMFNAVRDALNSGELSKALRLLNGIEKNEETLDEIENLTKAINSKKIEAEKLWEEFNNSLIEDNAISVSEILDNIIGIWKDFPEVAAFKKNWSEARAGSNFRLTLRDGNSEREFILLQGKSFTFGRKDESANPDVVFDDKRVSRNHARIFIENNKVVIEDMNSHVGTFINGNKISKSELNNNDLLTFSKIFDFKVHIQSNCDNGEICALLLKGAAFDVIIVISSALFGFTGGRVVSGKDDYLFKIIERKIILISKYEVKNKLKVITNGSEIILNNDNYLIREMK